MVGRPGLYMSTFNALDNAQRCVNHISLFQASYKVNDL